MACNRMTQEAKPQERRPATTSNTGGSGKGEPDSFRELIWERPGQCEATTVWTSPQRRLPESDFQLYAMSEICFVTAELVPPSPSVRVIETVRGSIPGTVDTLL